MQVLFALAGLHRLSRGAEVALESVARELAARGDEVTVAGAGPELPGRAYRFRHLPAVSRRRFERWPKFPPLRSEYAYEELTFAAGLALAPWWRGCDVTVTCGYPFTNWALRRRLPGGRRPAHVFVTQNGDWPAWSRDGEYRLFSCDGLVCTNPPYFERNRERWHATLIPNGIDTSAFRPGPGERAAFGLPAERRVVLMVSALIESKRVLEGLRAVARLPEAFLVVAGDGPLREAVDREAARLLPGRFLRGTFPHERMPALYRSADVFLHTAAGESFGNVYVEALASGLPVVAHDDEVTRWVLERHAGLVDAADERALAAALQRALAGGAAGRAERVAFAATRYAWSAVAARYRDFLAEVVARARAGREGAR